jgi:hypothetical protein
MSKKMPPHKRLFKMYKSGFFNKVEMTAEQKQMLEEYYPFLFNQNI